MGPFEIIILCIVLFFALRFLFLWYWKVDDLVKNQEKQIELLESIIKQLSGSTPVEESESTEEKTEA